MRKTNCAFLTGRQHEPRNPQKKKATRDTRHRGNRLRKANGTFLILDAAMSQGSLRKATGDTCHRGNRLEKTKRNRLILGAIMSQGIFRRKAGDTCHHGNRLRKINAILGLDAIMGQGRLRRAAGDKLPRGRRGEAKKGGVGNMKIYRCRVKADPRSGRRRQPKNLQGCPRGRATPLRGKKRAGMRPPKR